MRGSGNIKKQNARIGGPNSACALRGALPPGLAFDATAEALNCLKLEACKEVLPRRAETSVCPTFTIAHVNATHPSSELEVVSVLSKNLSPVRPLETLKSYQQRVMHYLTLQLDLDSR